MKKILSSVLVLSFGLMLFGCKKSRGIKYENASEIMDKVKEISNDKGFVIEYSCTFKNQDGSFYNNPITLSAKNNIYLYETTDYSYYYDLTKDDVVSMYTVHNDTVTKDEYNFFPTFSGFGMIVYQYLLYLNNPLKKLKKTNVEFYGRDCMKYSYSSHETVDNGTKVSYIFDAIVDKETGICLSYYEYRRWNSDHSITSYTCTNLKFECNDITLPTITN